MSKKEIVIHRKSHRLGGNHSKYDEKKHIQLLYDVFTVGRGVMGFCADAMIDRKTFYNWLKKHKKFKKAYNVVINIAGDKWERYPLQAAKRGEAFNYQYWHLIMRNRFSYSGINVPNVKDKSTNGKLSSAWKGLTKGNLTPQEYNQMVNGIVVELKAKELDLKAKELELKQKEIESKNSTFVSDSTDEALKAYMLVKEGKAKFVDVNGRTNIIMVDK